MTEFILPTQLDLSEAAQAHADLLLWTQTGAAHAGAKLDLDAREPNQVALQLLVATVRHLESLGAEVVLGEHAQHCMKAQRSI
ncbi:MAG: hypothetical protein N4A61_06010 [Pelagimonas sp.]|jgi:hypothetical protein|nr:hypothetical protein [Pelagimonas sp.]